MYFDSLTLTAVTDELRETILGGRIQRVVLTGPLSVGLEIYAHGRRHQLLASAHPQFARVHLVRGKLTRGVAQDTPMLLLMRKYILGGRVVGVEQPPFERVLLLSIVKALNLCNRGEDAALAVATSPAGGLKPPALDVRSLLTQARQPASAGFADPSPWLQPPGVGPQHDVATAMEDEALADEVDLDDGPEPSFTGTLLHCELVIEPQDRRSNIILVDANNLILDSVKRVTPRMSSRIVMPRQVYAVPPPLDKRDPAHATAADIEALAAGGTQDLAKALVTAYKGVSPQVAREVVLRALGRPQASLDEALPHYTIAARLRELVTSPPAPTLVPGTEGPSAYAPYTLTHLAGAEPAASMSAALEAFYSAREAVTGHSQRRDALGQAFAAARERLARQHDQIAGELDKARELERLRWEGEMIFAFLHELRPGQLSLELEGRTITLDPRQSAVEQAQARFKQYDKAKSAIAGLPERLVAVANRLLGLDELAALLLLSDEFAQIEQIALEAEELGYLREHPDPAAKRRPRVPKARPLRLLSSDGMEIFVGRSARQNEEVSFRIGRGADLWAHARMIHGAHVIVRSDGREVPEATLAEAAGLAAYFSQARDEPAVEVDLCRRTLVRKVPGGPPGLVTYRAERTVRAAPRKPW